jgi:hypothetical protein
MTEVATTAGGDRSLTPDEHACAKVTAFHIALARSDGRNPPAFDRMLTNGDFLRAAGLLIALSGVSGVIGGSAMLHEPDLNDEHRGRWLPIALRRFPELDDHRIALEEFTRLQGAMSDWEYWSLLGHIWVFSQKDPGVFNHHYSETYRGLFASSRLGKEQLMTPHERAALSSFGTPMTVFRGCQTGLNENGLSWSRDQEVAEWFAHRYYPYAPRSILRGTCNRIDAIAYFDYDNEEEVIIWGVDVAGKTKIND